MVIFRTKKQPNRHGLWRDTDNSIIAGVCAGIAHYFGFNITLTRLAAIILMIFLPLIFIIGYAVLAWLLPKKPTDIYPDEQAQNRAHTIHRSPSETLSTLRGRMNSLERKIRRIETQVTDKDYALKQKFREL